jgi:hypothetical protein
LPGTVFQVGENERFRFRFDPRYARAARVFGVKPENAWVDVSPDDLDARFGRWRLRTPLTNVSQIEPTGPYAFLKTAGPARLAVTDRGLTFATNGERGALIKFHVAVPGIEPLGMLRHPELTVTVADVDALIALLRTRIGQARPS